MSCGPLPSRSLCQVSAAPGVKPCAARLNSAFPGLIHQKSRGSLRSGLGPRALRSGDPEPGQFFLPPCALAKKMDTFLSPFHARGKPGSRLSFPGDFCYLKTASKPATVSPCQAMSMLCWLRRRIDAIKNRRASAGLSLPLRGCFKTPFMPRVA